MKKKRFKVIERFFKDCAVIKMNKMIDQRGYFVRIFCLKEINKILKKKFKVVQSAKSFSKLKGTFRGLHMQTGKMSEEKYVFCEQGSLYDIIVDMRKNSKTYLKVKKISLNGNDDKVVFISKGCAHGFLTKQKNTSLVYLYSNNHNKNYEKIINYKDKRLKIKLPLKVRSISEKDRLA